MSADLAFVSLAAFASVIAIAVGMARHRPARRWPWMLVAAALAIHAVASLVDAVRVSEITRSQPAFAALNAGHLASVVLGIAALRDLLIRSLPQRDREAAVDAGIVSLAVGLVVFAAGYQHGSAPEFDLTSNLVILWQVLVCGALLRVAFSGLLVLGAARWLVAAIVIGQVGSVWVLVGPAGTEWVNTLVWAAALLCPGLAALNRSMRDLSAHVVRGGSPLPARARMTLLGASLVAVPAAMLLRDSEEFWPQGVLSIGLVVTSVAAAWRMLGLVHQRDVAAAELELANVELEHLAGEDALTGLANRRRFMQVLHEAVTRRYGGRVLAVVLVDLDRFKLINDGIGHGAGDQVLVAVARRLESAIRAGDTAARLGGDEFAVVCPDLDSERVAHGIAERIARAVNGVYELDRHRHHVTGSIGVAVATGHATTAPELLRNADVAMYQAKQRGRARVEHFNRALDDRSARQLRLANALPEALDRDEFVVVYQPEIELRDGAVLWAEALLRWRHPTEGLLLPDAFLDIAEETGAIVPIGHWVLREACAQLAWWHAHHPDSAPTTVSVNVSSRQLADPHLIGTIRQALADAALDPPMLWLEVTETSVMQEPQLVAETLAGLKRLGVGVALDDFGTGYSSLAYLKKFPVDALKIDRSFVAGMTRDPQDRMIVSAIVSLAHAFGQIAVAEGVETAEQVAALRHLRCDFGQGNLWSKPLEPDGFTTWMNDRGRPVMVQTSRTDGGL
jgi:diguanylate cyclase (GGDEF)-like protein